MRSIFLAVFFCSVHFVSAQPEDRPTDFLSGDFHEGRRQKLRSTLPPHSVAVFLSNPTRNRSNDVDFEFHQDPDFYYLTGHKEPNSLLLVFKEKHTPSIRASYPQIIFLQSHKP